MTRPSDLTRSGSSVEVRVWVRTIAISSDERELLERELVAAERARMARFYHDADALRFLVGRATLRRQVARFLGSAPRDVALTPDANGKPRVIGGEPRINVSHSGDVVLVALAQGVEIGVDVEAIDPRHATELPLDSVFSPREVREHLALPAELRLASFFHIWTAKEALLKAAGSGLAVPLDSFDVTVDPRCPPALLEARCPALRRDVVCMSALEVPAGHAAALAVFADCHVRYE